MSPKDPLLPGLFRVERLYESAARLVAPASRWRRALVDNMAPRAGDVIVEIGCGAGALAIALALSAPRALVIAVDPDAAALEGARLRAAQAGAKIEVVRGLGAEAPHLLANWAPNKVIANFVERPHAARDKRETIAAAHAALRPDGFLHLADFEALEPPPPVEKDRDLMLALMRGAGFVAAERTEIFPAARGDVALFRARMT
ncbi:MAG: methyltransferase domain-containing protein [Hyphomonadaceae bacterium]|nr:methyltransferase domain-containing protein [Hyphomonadaceae bacterium]